MATFDDSLQYRIEDANWEADNCREKLVYRLQSLAENLTREANHLKRDPNYTHNSLGIVQSQGLDIDLLCKELEQRRNALKVLTALGQIRPAPQKYHQPFRPQENRTMMTFEKWMALVDEYANRNFGISIYDLSDCRFMDWFEDGMRPSVAAKKARRQEAE